MSFRFLIPLALALALSAQDQPARPTGTGINFFNPDTEIAMGAQLAKAVLRDTNAFDSAPVQRYAARLGGQLAAQAGGPNFPYSFTVVASKMGGPTHEPIALPGGPIFISADLILAAQNEAEFAGMLAHAVAHVAGRHYARQMTRENLMQIGAIAASMSTNGPAGMAESQADSLAVRTMSKAGYDPAALAAYIRRLQPAHATGTPKIFSPIPAVEERVQAIEKAIANLPAQTYTSGGDFQAIQDTVRSLTAK
jgi:predicted Zn-dependent protease